MSRINYTVVCPECQKENKEAHLGFDMESQKFTCDGETVHSFDEMPGEQAPAVSEETSGFKPDSQTASSVHDEPMTPEEEAALNEAMLHPPRPRDFGSMVSEGVDPVTEPEIVAPEQAGTQETASSEDIVMVAPRPGEPPEPVVMVRVQGNDTWVSRNSPIRLPNGNLLVAMEIGEDGPRVGLGEVIVLNNGDAICGVKVSELWVSAMQAEGENRTPALNLAEYLQEIMDTGLIEWHSSVPGAR